jgi:glycosyltransferase involved in cell wall biosynthesis
VILWLASYPRSGNSFLRVVLKVAFGVGSNSVYGAGSAVNRPLPHVGEGQDPDRLLADMAVSADLCPVKTHELPGDDEHPAIYVVRDGRDTLVSYAHYAMELVPRDERPVGGDSFLAMLRALVFSDGYFGGWGRHAIGWTERKAPTAVIRFEELIADPVSVVGQALERLEIRAERTGSALPSFSELHRAWPEFFREGRVGSYRDEMPHELEDLFWSRHGRAMRRHGYSLGKLCVDGPLVTVVTPSYCQGRFIRDTIESVVGQDYPHIEHLIIDGGSTDETAEVAGEYASQLTWISEKDRGQSDAINKGFRMARGEIVCWLNSDDLLLPRAVSRAVAAFEQDADLDAVYGDAYRIDAGGEVLGEFPKAGPLNLWKLIYYSDYIVQPTVFMRRRALGKVGCLDESLNWGMDWDLFIRLGKRGRMAYIPELQASQREYDETKTASGGLRRLRELVRIMRRHGRRRYPPAFFAYGIDTWINVLRTHSPAFLTPALSRAATTLWQWLVLRTLVQWEGWYADGWATKKTHFVLRRSGEEIRIRGSLPPVSEGLRGQRLRISCNGVRLTELAVAFGDFEHVVSLKALAADEMLEVTIEAARSFVPRDEGLNDDPRRLAYLLRDVA